MARVSGGKPLGTVTRGTTGPNRLRRSDRWLVGPQGRRLRRARDPLVVDLGYGAHPVTTVELWNRLRAVRPDVQVVGIEIDRSRVAAARGLEREGLTFRYGGFELPLPAGRRPVLVRAFNVLRQYPVQEVFGAWEAVRSRLAPDGLFIDGTCDELGRLSAWVAVTEEGPRSVTLSVRLADLGRPSRIAERLPKILIHRNVPGEPIHAVLRELETAWEHNAGLATFGARQRWVAGVRSLRERGFPVLPEPSRWRLGELTLPWDAVAPRGGNDRQQMASTSER
jgi:hypothetical protein